MRLDLRFSGSCAIAAGRKQDSLEVSPELTADYTSLFSSIQGRMTNPVPFMILCRGRFLKDLLAEGAVLNEGDHLRIVPVLLGG
jgi:hypothetical protein